MDKSSTNSHNHHLAFTQHHAFIIGIDAYQKVSPLQTAVADAEQIAKVLSIQQHFLVHPPLLNATGADIRALLEHTLAKVVGKDDRVFFYFAGHGIAADGDDGPAGYIVPVDADPTNFDTFIPMDALQLALNNLPCRHLLLVMDCCFSGAFKWSSSHRDIILTMPKKIYKERFDRFIEDPAWQVITSSAYDQKALDVLRGKTTGERGQVNIAGRGLHSPFAQALFDGLSGEADSRNDSDGEGDGVITATELYAYIRDRVEPESINEAEHLRQTPGFFPLQKHDKGEFIFLKPNHRLNLPPIPKHSPYKGLVSFDESDTDLFYGRDHSIQALLAKAKENKLLVVTGASGTGKSSVIKAGLLPALRAEGCRILDVIRPGVHPLAALEQALAQAKLDTSGAHESSRLGAVLLIDQLEEVITRCEDPQERIAFDKRLRDLLDDERIHKLILTVRSDFEPQFSDGALKLEWQKGRYTVPPFSIEELKDVVLLPTLQEVLIFDPPELVDTIVAEVVQSPGALPLLSYTLNELYEAYRTGGRQDRALKKDDYEKLGGVMGALRNKADGVYANLLPPAQEVMRKIMLRMVSVEGELAGKRVFMDDLIYTNAQKETVASVVEKLVEARLIVKGRNYIEPAHDALVRAWKLLHDWTFSVGKDKLILGTKLNIVATEFALTGDNGLLWNNNPNLPVLLKEVNEPQHWFNAKEISFINQSYRKKVNNRRLLFGTTSLVIISLAFAAIYSARQNYDARNELQRSTSLRIGSVANDILNNDNLNLPGGSERALQQTLAASRLVGPERNVGWMQSLLASPLSQTPAENLASALIAQMSLTPNVQYLDLDFTIRQLTASADSQYIVAGGHRGNNGVVVLWDAEQGSVTSLRNEPNESIYTVALSPNGEHIAASGVGGKLLLWNNSGNMSTPVSIIKMPFGLIAGIAFSADNKQIAVTGNDQEVKIYNVSDLTSVDTPAGAQPQATSSLMLIEPGRSIAFSANGNYLVAGSYWGKRVWNLNRDNNEWINVNEYRMPDDISGFKGPPVYSSVAINSDGSLIVAAGKEARGDEHGSLWLWSDATDYAVSKELKGLTDATTVAFSPDGSQIVAGGPEGKVVIWDVQTAEPVAERTIAERLNVMAVIFSSDGESVISSTEDGIVTFWDPKPIQNIMVKACESSAVSPDGTRFIEGRAGDVTYGQGGSLNLFVNDSEKTIVSMGSKGHSKGVGNHNKELPQGDNVICVKYSEDGSTVVSSSSNNTVQFWKADADSVNAIGPSILGSGFEFALDERLIAVLEREASEDQAMLVRLYDTESRNPVGFWLPQTDDWATIIQNIQAIPTSTDLNEKLCSRLVRNMSYQEWSEWVSPEIEYIAQCPDLPISSFITEGENTQ